MDRAIDIEAAKEWVNERCAALVRRSTSAASNKGPVRQALENALAIGVELDAHGHPMAHKVSEETANYLYYRSFFCPDTYDIAIRVVARNLLNGFELPNKLQVFASIVITGSHRRPAQRGRRRSDNWERDCEILHLLNVLVVDFDMNPTRNDETTRSASACDLVAAGFAIAGQKMITYKAVKAIWHSARLRQELRLIQSLVGAKYRDSPPEFVTRCESPFDVPEN
jgi:hypothetical protein